MQTALLPTTQAAHHTVVRDTAKEIADFMLANPGCTRDDLLVAGFAAYQIDRFGTEASALANRLSVRRLA